MNNFKKGGFKKSEGTFGGRPKSGGVKKFGGNFAGGRSGGDRPGGYTQLFDAVCFTCKKNCRVPFRPTRDKPVYCRECFDKQEQVPGRNSQRRERLSAQSGDGIDGLKRQLITLESKVNRILELVSKKVL